MKKENLIKGTALAAAMILIALPRAGWADPDAGIGRQSGTNISQAATGGPVVTKWEKSPLLAGILSLLLPGGGQYYNGQVGKALLVEGAIGGGILMILSSYQETKIYHESDGYCFFGGCQWDTIRTRDEGLQIAGGILAGAAWVYSIVDAPVQSMEMNRRRAERLDLRVTGPGSSRLPGGGWVAGAEMTYHF